MTHLLVSFRNIMGFNLIFGTLCTDMIVISEKVVVFVLIWLGSMTHLIVRCIVMKRKKDNFVLRYTYMIEINDPLVIVYTDMMGKNDIFRCSLQWYDGTNYIYVVPCTVMMGKNDTFGSSLHLYELDYCNICLFLAEIWRELKPIWLFVELVCWELITHWVNLWTDTMVTNDTIGFTLRWYNVY